MSNLEDLKNNPNDDSILGTTGLSHRVRRAAAKALASASLATGSTSEHPEGYLQPGETPGALAMDQATGEVHATGKLYGVYGQPVEGPMRPAAPDELPTLPPNPSEPQK